MIDRETHMAEAVVRMKDFIGVVAEDGSIPDVQAFVRTLAGTNLYWIVMTYGLEWAMVVRRISLDFLDTEEEELDPLVFRQGIRADFPEYSRLGMELPPDLHFLRKDKVPAEVLSVRLGVALEAITKAKYIRLRPKTEWAPEGLPEPTVGEWGQSRNFH